MIPKIIHFIWLTPPDGKDFKLYHKLAVLSAYNHNKDYKILFHTDNEPSSQYFKDIKHLVEVTNTDIPHSVFGISITYMAMKADVLRLRLMKEYGGVYLDLDIITLRSYSQYLNNKVCLGMELSSKMNFRQVLYFLRTFQWDIIRYKFRFPTGLCSGFMMGEKGHVFFDDWLDGYKKFDNENWAYFPVKLPYIMYKTGKYDIKILGPYQTHYPSSDIEDLKKIFEDIIHIPDKLFLHFWESKSNSKYLYKIDEEYIKNTNSTFTNSVKRYLN